MMTNTIFKPSLVGLLLSWLSIFTFLVHATSPEHPGHHDHQKFHNRANLAASNHSSVQNASSSSQQIIDQALAAMEIANNLRIQNIQFNQYKFKDRSARSIISKAPPLDLSSESSDHGNLTAGNSKASRSLTGSNGTNPSGSDGMYSIPKDLAQAARQVAEAEPQTPSTKVASSGMTALLAAFKHETEDTNAMPQKLVNPDGLFEYVSPITEESILGINNVTAPKVLSKRAPGDFWIETIPKNGISPFAPAGYQVWRNVKLYGAKGDGVTDDTAAINRAISDGGRCGLGCGSSTIHPAVVFFPGGTYLVSTSIIQYYNTQFLGNPNDLPTILAASSFIGLGVISSDVYTGESDTAQWYINQNNFLRSVRNFIVDISRTSKTAPIFGIHWQVAQGTSLQNIKFIASTVAGNDQRGIFMENGSGGFLSDLSFFGGSVCAFFGNQQFTTNRLTFDSCAVAAIQIHWDWAWTMQDIIIHKCAVGLKIVGGAGGVGSTGQGVGSLIIVDAIISETPIGILTSLYAENSTSLLLQNIAVTKVPVLVKDDILSKTLLIGSDTKKSVDSWGFGRVSDAKGTSSFANGQAIAVMNRTASLTGPNKYGNYNNLYTRVRPNYLNGEVIIDVKSRGAKGDGVSDDTPVLNSILAQAANLSSVVYFPFGVYIIKDTLNIPLGSRIIGQAWSQIMATGVKFQDESAPHVAVKVGNVGDVGVIEIQDMMFTVAGPTAGAIVLQWNVHESVQGSAALWDTHIRVGGAIGSKLQTAQCPKLTGQVNPNCIAASLLMHITPTSSGYFENLWVWVADHDLDRVSQDQIDIYAGRGILIESQGPTWLYGSTSEHCVLYQYQISEAKNLLLGMIQTESPYYQVKPKAPVPFKPGLFPNDPTWNCPATSTTCAVSWAVRIIDSSTIYILGAGLYSWFKEYSQVCLLTDNCQDRGFEIEQSYDLWIYNVATKAIVEMITPANGTATLAKDNKNGFLSSIMAWLGGAMQTAGATFQGLRFHELDWLLTQDLPVTCRTALSEVVKCDDYVVRFEMPAYQGALGNLTLTDSICTPTCGTSLKNNFNNVKSSCGSYQLDGVPPTKVVGVVWQGWNETCLKDTASTKYCNEIIADYPEVDDIALLPKTLLCSYCFTTRIKMMQSTPYSIYNQRYNETLALIYSSCGGTGSTVIPPPLVKIEPPPSFCVSNKFYTTKAGDTCDSISTTFKLSSASLFMGNDDIHDCNNIKPGINFCLPLPCGVTYTLQPEDTCPGIEFEHDIGIGKLRALNPWIAFDCRNLQFASRVYGKVLCLAPEGGIFNLESNATSYPTVKSGYSDKTINPPANAVLATGTTRFCGAWYRALADDSCSSICVQNGIPFGLFVQANPSLTTAACESKLVVGSTYCVAPNFWFDSPTTPDDPAVTISASISRSSTSSTSRPVSVSSSSLNPSSSVVPSSSSTTSPKPPSSSLPPSPTTTTTTTASPTPTGTCTDGFGTGASTGLCSFSCHYGYCPAPVCTCRVYGQAVPPPPANSPVGYPISPTDGFNIGLCSFACTRGYCPDTACTTVKPTFTFI